MSRGRKRDRIGDRPRALSCIDFDDSGLRTADNRFKREPHADKGLQWRFGDLGKLDTHGDVKTQDSGTNVKTNRGWPSTGAKTNDTAHGMAEDIGKLQRPDKTKVAGLLSKTISGAEVVEIRAVSQFAKSSPNEKRSRLQKQQYNNF